MQDVGAELLDEDAHQGLGVGVPKDGAEGGGQIHVRGVQTNKAVPIQVGINASALEVNLFFAL